jgi:hypothetical protein
MQDQKPGDEDVNEAEMESFPASDPPSYSTPHPEYQSASAKDDRITPGTWVMAVVAVALFLWLVSLAF